MNFGAFITQVSVLLTLPAIVLLGIAAALIVVARDWRLVLLAYAIESTVLAVLLTQRMPLEWALLQAIVGGLVAVMLFLSARQLRNVHLPGSRREGRWPHLASLTLFRFLTLGLAFLAFLAIHDRVELPQTNSTLRDGVVWLALVGGLGLALHEEPLHAGLSLFTVLNAFLLLFFGLTRSRLMIGVMEGWQLLLALAVAYLTVSRGLAGMASAPADLYSPWWRP